MTKQIILSKEQKMVYDYLSIADSYSKDISIKLGMSRRKVDAICIALEHYGLIESEKTTFKDPEGYYHFSKIYSIVIDKDIKPIECWSQEEFLMANKELQQMIDIEYMIEGVD